MPHHRFSFQRLPSTRDSHLYPGGVQREAPHRPRLGGLARCFLPHLGGVREMLGLLVAQGAMSVSGSGYLPLHRQML